MQAQRSPDREAVYEGDSQARVVAEAVGGESTCPDGVAGIPFQGGDEEVGVAVGGRVSARVSTPTKRRRRRAGADALCCRRDSCEVLACSALRGFAKGTADGV